MNVQAALINVALLWLLTTPHEFAHAWVATKLGDDTPRREGRVTLNPLAHVDWIGTVLLPAVTSLIGAGFLGWGKPVNTNPSKLRGGLNGLVLVALAGPASNVVFAVVLAAVAAATAQASLPVANFAAQGGSSPILRWRASTTLELRAGIASCPYCANRKAKKPSCEGSADLGGPHNGDRAAGLFLTWLHRLAAQIFEIVGEIIDLSRCPALAHVNAAVELRQLR